MAHTNHKSRTSSAAQPSNVIEAWFTQSKANFEKLSRGYSGEAQADAFVRAASIAIEGGEEILKSWSSLFQDMAERNRQTFQSLLTATDFKNMAEMQGHAVQETVNDLIGGFATLSEMSVRVTTAAIEPLSAGMAHAKPKTGQEAA